MDSSFKSTPGWHHCVICKREWPPKRVDEYKKHMKCVHMFQNEKKRKRLSIPNDFDMEPKTKRRKFAFDLIKQLESKDTNIKRELIDDLSDIVGLGKPFDEKNKMLIEKKEEKQGLESSKLEIDILKSEIEKQTRLMKEMSNKFAEVNKSHEISQNEIQKISSFHDQISKNIVNIIMKFPKNSSLRKSLVGNLMVNIFDKKKFVDEFIVSAGLNDKYTYSIKAKDLDSLFEIKYPTKKKTKSKWTEGEIQAFTTILDDVMPYVSGRGFRIRQWTKEDTYREYATISERTYPNQRIMGYTAFWKRFKSLKQKVHFIKVVKHCPICNAMTKRDKGEETLTGEEEQLLESNSDHAQEIKDAYNHYKSIKEKIASEKLTDSCLIIQDYSQYNVSGAFYQSLILCIYSFDTNEDKLVSRFYHIFRHNEDARNNETNKNDKWFTYSAWVFFMENNTFGDFRKFYVYSDGASKHFKCRQVHLFWYSLLKKYPNKIVSFEYCYFKSNHSNNPSDTGSAHGKQQLKFWCIAHQRTPVENEFQVAEIIETRRNNKADVISVYSQVNDPCDIMRKFSGLRKTHRFVYNLQEKKITTYNRGFDEEKGVEFKQEIVLNDNEIDAGDEVIENIWDHQNLDD